MEKNKIYVAVIKHFNKVRHSDNECVDVDMHAFSDEKESAAFMRDEFFKICDDKSIEELGNYEFFDEENGEFRLQEEKDTIDYGHWRVDAKVTVIDV